MKGRERNLLLLLVLLSAECCRSVACGVSWFGTPRDRVQITTEQQEECFLGAFSRCDSVKSRRTLLNLGAVAMGANNFFLAGLGQGQDLGKRLVASEAQVFVCRHIRLARSVQNYFTSRTKGWILLIRVWFPKY